MLMVDQVVHGVGVLTAVCIDQRDEDGGLVKLGKPAPNKGCLMLIRLSIGSVADSKDNAHGAGCMNMNGKSLESSNNGI